MHLNEDWNEFLSALTSTGTQYVLIGGHALAVHGEPRFTEDLDVFVKPTLANARRVVRALVEFGFGSIAPDPVEMARPGLVWMLGRKPRRIDILTGISGVTYEEASRGSLRVKIGAVAVRVIGRSALIKNKVAFGRPKDLADVAMLGTAMRPKGRGRRGRG